MFFIHHCLISSILEIDIRRFISGTKCQSINFQFPYSRYFKRKQNKFEDLFTIDPSTENKEKKISSAYILFLFLNTSFIVLQILEKGKLKSVDSDEIHF